MSYLKIQCLFENVENVPWICSSQTSHSISPQATLISPRQPKIESGLGIRNYMILLVNLTFASRNNRLDESYTGLCLFIWFGQPLSLWFKKYIWIQWFSSKQNPRVLWPFQAWQVHKIQADGRIFTELLGCLTRLYSRVGDPCMPEAACPPACHPVWHMLWYPAWHPVGSSYSLKY